MQRLLSFVLAPAVAVALCMAVPVAQAQCTGGCKAIKGKEKTHPRLEERKGGKKGRKGSSKDTGTQKGSGTTPRQSDAASKDAAKD